MRARRMRDRLERALVLVGCTCLGYYGYTTMQAAQFQREQTAAFEALVESAPVGDVVASPPTTAPNRATPSAAAARATTVASLETPVKTLATKPSSPVKLPDPRMIGLLEVPRLGLSTAVMSGDDAKTLNVSAGHLPDTPKPWEPGNSAIAAHRDRHFRPLKNIRVGDEVRMRTARGDMRYRVRTIRIVTPDDLSVLKPRTEDTLTLITCYPFNYIGSAPKRYIVQAERVHQRTSADSPEE